MRNTEEGRPPQERGCVGECQRQKASRRIYDAAGTVFSTSLFREHKGYVCALIRLSKGSSWFMATYQQIQREAQHYTARQIKRAVKRLEQDKWLEVYRHRPEGSSLSFINEYRVLHPKSPPKQTKRIPPKPCA